MSRLRIAVEWDFGTVVNDWAFLNYAPNLKLFKSRVGDYYKVGVLLSNIRTCLYGNIISQYFGIQPPKLQAYLKGVRKPAVEGG